MQGWCTSMEDAHAALLDLDNSTSFFGVYDGHGGHAISKFCAKFLHQQISSSGQLETWRLTHWDAKKGWTSTDAVALYDEMMKLRNQNSVESMSEKSIIEKVLGRDSVHLHGWGYDPAIARDTMGPTKKSKRPTYDQLVDAFETIKGKCAIMEQTLIDKNMMPPPQSTSEQPQDDTSESGENMDE